MRAAVTVVLGLGVVGVGLAPAGGWGEPAAGSARGMLGPPIVCHPIDAGDAKVLSLEGKEGYSAKRLADEVIKALDSEPSVLAHMETLRRVTLVVERDRGKAVEVLARLAWRAMDAAAQEKDAATAWFDAGFLSAAFGEMGVDLGAKPGAWADAQGYKWIERAINLRPDDGAMRFGAALASHPAMHREAGVAYEGQLSRAVVLAPPGSALEKNLKTHVENWSERSFEDLKRIASRDGGQ